MKTQAALFLFQPESITGEFDMYFFQRILCTSFAVLLICMTCLVSAVFADGKFVIKPVIETGFEREDNFFKSETQTRTVDTIYVKPGINFGYTTGKSLVSLDYSLNRLDYDDQDSVPSGQRSADSFNYTEHRADFNISTQPTDRLAMGIGNLFWKTRDPAGSDALSNAVDRYKYNMNRLNPWVQYQFADKFGLGLQYIRLTTDYTDDAPGEGEDIEENRGGLTLTYYLNSTTAFDLGYQAWNYDYDKTSVDYDSGQVMAGLNHQFNYFTARAEAGYHERDFDRYIQGGDIDSFVWKISLTGKNPREPVPIPKSSVYFALGSNFNDSGSGDSYYTTTRLDGRFTYLVLEKINLILKGWYQKADYEASTREDDRWLVSGGADYMFQNRFVLGIEAGREERDSNAAGFDFENNYVMLKAGFSYDLGSR